MVKTKDVRTKSDVESTAEPSLKQVSKRLTYRKSPRASAKSQQNVVSESAGTDRTEETVPRTPQDTHPKHPHTPSSASRHMRTPSSAQKNFISSQNSVPASETDSPNSVVAGTPSSKAFKHPTSRTSNESTLPKQRSALSRKRTASLVANTSPPEEIPTKRSRKGEPATQASRSMTTNLVSKKKSAKPASNGLNGSAARALSWSAQKRRVYSFKPVTPVSFYGASNDDDLDDKLAFMVESNGVLVRTELHKVKCEQEMKVKKEVKRIDDGKKRLSALKRNKVTTLTSIYTQT
jgi:hypothetical protein